MPPGSASILVSVWVLTAVRDPRWWTSVQMDRHTGNIWKFKFSST